MKSGLDIFFPVAQFPEWSQSREHFLACDIGYSIGNTPAAKVFSQLGDLLSLFFRGAFHRRVVEFARVWAFVNGIECVESAQHQYVPVPRCHACYMRMVLHQVYQADNVRPQVFRHKLILVFAVDICET